MNAPIAVYTDLDGTLLELETYDHTMVMPNVKRLKKQGIPVIFCSSKTLAEQIFYQEKLGISFPMIVENGSAVFIPKSFHTFFSKSGLAEYGNYWMHVLGHTAPFILDVIKNLKNSLNLSVYGYSDLDNKEISSLTSLSENDLQRTKERLFSETLIKGDFESATFKEFEVQLTNFDLQCVPGSKFYTITGKKSDKGKAIKWLQNQFKLIFGKQPESIGIGDSLNDMPMLKTVDHAYLVQKPDKTWANTNIPNLAKIEGIGPHGWNIIAGNLLMGCNPNCHLH